MAMTTEEFMRKTNCEVTGGNLIIGERGNRVKIGSVARGNLELTDFGNALLEAMNSNGGDFESALADCTVTFSARAEARRYGKPMPDAQAA